MLDYFRNLPHGPNIRKALVGIGHLWNIGPLRFWRDVGKTG